MSAVVVHLRSEIAIDSLLSNSRGKYRQVMPPQSSQLPQPASTRSDFDRQPSGSTSQPHQVYQPIDTWNSSSLPAAPTHQSRESTFQQTGGLVRPPPDPFSMPEPHLPLVGHAAPALVSSPHQLLPRAPPTLGDERGLLYSDFGTRDVLMNSSVPAAARLPWSTMDQQPSSQSGAAQLISRRTRRCSLHLRQQPRMARAGPDGKDRRAIDPPPILELLMEDFDVKNEDDVAELTSPFWIVHCKLVSALNPDKDVSTMSTTTEDGHKEVQRLLLGTTVASPTITADDPDPDTMEEHPKMSAEQAGPPSPTSRFLPMPSSRSNEAERAKHQRPGAFFIFADVSVRKAGDYRLQFTLMKMDGISLNQGATIPAIHTATSNVFSVVNAKDFDQVQPSTPLVKGLISRGAGFPLKLKKGTREGVRKRRQHSSAESDDESYDAE